MIAGYFYSPIAVAGLKERGKTKTTTQADGRERSSGRAIKHIRTSKNQ